MQNTDEPLTDGDQGGGSTFGVITSFTIKAIPTPKIVAGQFAMTAAPNSSVAVAIGSLVLSRIPDMVDMGGSGYMWSLASGPSPAGNGSIGGIYGVLAVEGSEDVTVLDRIWEPIVAEAKRRWGSAVQFQSIPAVFPSLYAYVKQYHDTTVAGTGKLIDTRLLSASAMRDEPAELTAANECAVRRGDNEQLGVMVVAGKGLHEAEPRGGDNAVHPFWRKSVALLAVHKEFGPFDAGARQAAVESVNGCMEHLRKLEPESGAYVNEVSLSVGVSGGEAMDVLTTCFRLFARSRTGSTSSSATSTSDWPISRSRSTPPMSSGARLVLEARAGRRWRTGSCARSRSKSGLFSGLWFFFGRYVGIVGC